VNDAAWIADLLAHGLIRSSFVPPQTDPGAARSYAHPLVREISQQCLRIQTPEDANLKLGRVFSNILAHSGRAIVQALIAAESDPQLRSRIPARLRVAPEFTRADR
jgi:hypothetical protein